MYKNPHETSDNIRNNKTAEFKCYASSLSITKVKPDKPPQLQDTCSYLIRSLEDTTDDVRYEVVLREHRNRKLCFAQPKQ